MNEEQEEQVKAIKNKLTLWERGQRAFLSIIITAIAVAAVLAVNFLIKQEK